jgi:hypothetical protein
MLLSINILDENPAEQVPHVVLIGATGEGDDPQIRDCQKTDLG